MNVSSTASVLPRTPADVNGMLSVAFIGNSKYKSACVRQLFKIRKHKVWAFLIWLKQHNHLYNDIELDSGIMEEYSDGYLPGVHDRIVDNDILNSSELFKDETAGLTEHPSEMFVSSNTSKSAVTDSSDDETVHILLETTGVADPEGVTIPGRSLNAAALRNMVSKSFARADLSIYQSSNAVSEYNNTSLFPGMFPTLFPYGIGGMDDPKRTTKIALQKHVDYLFDIHNHTFRYHNSFMFVALNIHQRRLAHLHTYFTVKRSNFQNIAQKLVAISPESLQRASNTLESEGNITKLVGEEKDALNLLKEVNAVTTQIPGSQAAKIRARNEIISYVGAKGSATIIFNNKSLSTT